VLLQKTFNNVETKINMFNKNILVIALLLLMHCKLMAQPKTNLQSYVPAAPNAAELGKYGSIPVGNITGIPDISFPLYEIKAGTLSLPISLTYHAAGVQLNQKASDAGVGWSVNAGGQITRTIYGVKDDGQYGYFNYTPPSQSQLQANTNYYSVANYNIINGGGYDLEPDLFVYNIGGKSGKFICTKEKNFMTIPFESIQIGKQTDLGYVTFKMVDENGTTYNFRNCSSTVSDINQQQSNISTWNLTSIISANLTDTISFIYDTVYFNDLMEHDALNIGYREEDCTGSAPLLYSGSSDGFGLISKSYSNHTYHELIIKKINFKNGFVLFNRNTIRQDYVDQTHKSLDEIVVYNNFNQLVKRIAFDHDYYYSPAGINETKYRLRLKNFSDSSITTTEKKQYSFAYDSTVLPPYNTYNMDYWGYYNGSNNLGLMPANTVYMEPNSNIYSEKNFCGSIATNFGNANRAPNANYMQAGILKTITYPTGGHTSFSFEPNQYVSDEYVQQNYSPGLTTAGTSPGVLMKDSLSFSLQQAFATLNPSVYATVQINFSGAQMPYTDNADGFSQRVMLTDVTTNTVLKTWNHDGDITAVYSINDCFTLIPAHTYKLTNLIHGTSSTNIQAGITWSENTNQRQTKIGGGLRVKAVQNYSADNTLLQEENYVYGENENGLGVKLFDEKYFYKNYEEVYNAFYVQSSSPTIAFCSLKNTWLQRNYFSVSKYNSINYLGTSVLYSSTTKYVGNASAKEGKTIYRYNILQDNNTIPSAFINSGNYGTINNLWNQGLQLDEINYQWHNSQYAPIAKTNFSYSGYKPNTEYALGFKQTKQFIKLCNCLTDSSGPETNSNQFGQGFFTLYPYPLATGAMRKTNETKTSYHLATGDSTVAVYNYQYNNLDNLLLTQSSFNNSGVETNITRYKYPHDYSAPIYTMMVAKNILTPVIEQTTWVSRNNTESLLSSVRNNYKQMNNLFVPDSIQYSMAANPLETRIKINQYDNFGNVLEQQKINDAKEVYLWSYSGQYPVAKITGSDFNTVNSLFNQSQLDALANMPNNDAGVRSLLHELRSKLPNAQVFSFTYKPLVGLTSQTDASGKTVFYEYDGLNRLRHIRDDNENILKKYTYNFSGQQESNTDIIYTSTKTQTFIRNNCGIGANGSSVSYSATASSTINQADADAKAQADVNNNGQAYANANGFCTFYSVSKSGSFTKNNCAVVGTGSQVTYAVAVGAYTSTISQADADAKAQTDLNNNGQVYANTNGICTFYSAAKSGVFTKNNCAPGGAGSQVTYPVAAGTYSSTISQADANAKAQTDVNNNGQTYANNNGFCTFYNVSTAGNFTKNNCAAGGTGSSVTYNVPAARYSSTISQADANAKAQTDVNNNGQTYANNNGYCTFFNVYKSGTFVKNNCAAGGTGSSVPYPVPAAKYSSTISQADADAKAQTDVNNNGQTYANNNGYCTFYSAAKSGVFTKNNCAAGGTGSQVTYPVAAGAYYSTISQADADAKAQTYVNNNGQTYANNNGYCTFYNTARSQTFTRNNCGTDQIAGTATYTVGASAYSSTISQADADAKAQNEINANGQTYANTYGTCTQVYYNTAISMNYTKNNCYSGYIGSTVTYNVTARKYSSIISQTDAQNQAQNDLVNNGQTYANFWGTCIPVYYNTARSQAFTRNNCPTNYVGSTVTYTVAANTYSSTVSQVDADAKAQNNINANGQSYANTYGTCTFVCCSTTGIDKKCVNGSCQTGIKVYTYSQMMYGSIVCTYHYEWSDGSWSDNYQETNTSACISYNNY
jgi:YD repeat-containing protein